MLKNLTIKARLLGFLGFLIIVLLMQGGTGLLSLGQVNQSLKTVYEDRLVCLGQLDSVIRLLNRNELELALLIAAKPEAVTPGLEVIAKRKSELEKVWQDYVSTYLTPDEKQLADQFAALRKNYEEDAEKSLIAAITSGDREGAEQLLQGKITTQYKPISDTMNKLIQLQIDVGKSEYDSSQDRYALFRVTSFSVVIISVVVGCLIGGWLIRSINGPLEMAITLASRVAKGDLTENVRVTTSNEMGRLLQALKDMSDSLTHTVSRVRSSTDTIATASGQIAAGNLDLSQRTEAQAASLEETASSMEQLTSTVRQNAENARKASTLVGKANTQAIGGGEIVGKVVDTMGAIKESSTKIVDIINVIDGIAFQTNILALNAAVEAARAGEQGRGFAVVASEVRSLAQRSASAAKEIKQLIDDSVDKVNSGSELVDRAGAAMSDIVVSVREVSDIMKEIALASGEQSDGIDQINLAVVQMDQVTQQNAALVEQAAAAAKSLNDQADMLARAVSVFRLEQVQVSTLSSASAAPLSPSSSSPLPSKLSKHSGRPQPTLETSADAGDDWTQF